MKILITLPFPDRITAPLKEISSAIEVLVLPAQKAGDIPEKVWQTVDVLYTNKVLPEESLVPNLKWIQFHWAGVNHAIGHPLLRKKGLICTTLSGAAATQVAEYIVMMLLALGHRLSGLMDAQRKKEWAADRWERFQPVELRDHTVGIVGYGSIGRQVARILHAFGATVLATKNDAMQPEDTGYYPNGYGDPHGEYVHRLYPSQALRSMVKECDFVVITVPLSDRTRGLINSDVLSSFKPGSFLVDVSRGGIVNHDALIAAINDRRLAGAGLDVFPEEPLPEDSPLWEMKNVLISPHISGNTPYYDERAMVLFSDNIKRFLENKPLLNVVDLEKGY